ASATAFWQKEFNYEQPSDHPSTPTSMPPPLAKKPNQLAILSKKLAVGTINARVRDDFSSFINVDATDIPPNCTPLEWWCQPQQRKQYPKLNRTAICILSILAESSEPERTVTLRTLTMTVGITWTGIRAGAVDISHRHKSFIPYPFPNDTPERERLGVMGECYKRLMNDRLYMAPLSAKKPPRNILDIATGVGDWAIQMGDLFPDSTVLAQTYLQFSQRMCLRTSTSMSKIRKCLFKYPLAYLREVSYLIAFRSDNWMFPQKFDYIHTRNTAGCWSAFETQIAEQAFAAL
ncbi:Uncharacterized protein HZ326_26522, partial [Fusarium oxysporum f. sp. albedinis]